MLIKPKPPTPKPKNKKKKLGDWKKSYDKKKVHPKKLPEGPGVKGKKKPPTKDKTKGKTPNWRDSTYLKQESYLKKLLAEHNADDIRSRADLAVYYGNEERAAQGEVREKDEVTKVPIKEQAAKKKAAVDNAIDAMNKYKKKKSPTPKKSDGLVARRPAPPKGTKPKKTKSKWQQYTQDEVKQVLKPKKKAVKYKTVVKKGRLVREAVAGSHASDGLYQKELAEARVKDKSDITDDYAARGVLHSGIYAQKQGDYEKEYGKQVTETNRQKASKYAEIAKEDRDFYNDQELQREQARLDAVRRRAAKTGKVT